MKNKRLIILFFLLSIAILWLLCPDADKDPPADGHLPSTEQNTASPDTRTPDSEHEQPLYNYYTVTENETDFDLSMHVLEVDIANPKLEVRPVSSHKTLFGYAYLSEMGNKWGAKAIVNGGFSHTNGLLGGMYAVEGELIVASSGQYPVLFKDGDKVFLGNTQTRVWIDGDSKLKSFYYNQYPKTDSLYVFTPYYGSQNRIRKPHLNAIITGGEVQETVLSNDSYDIPEDGFLISAIGEYSENHLAKIKPGMNLNISFETIVDNNYVTDFEWAYECGSWVLKDGEIIVPDSDNWVGTLKIRTPRTAVGIKEDGKLIFVVADGRQKGLSDGLTGRELAQELLKLNVRDAAFLDGGASSEMIIEGKIVNSPSAGRERMLAAAFIIREKSKSESNLTTIE